MMNTQRTPFIAILIVGLTFATGIPAYAASIVNATYSRNGEIVASMVYTGSDGGPNSDRVGYWKLLGKSPEGAYEVKFNPDKEDGKTATLEGDIRVSVEIRNKFNMGVAKTEKLTLVRDDVNSTRWYLPTKELKRIVALIDKNLAKDNSEAVQDGADQPATAPESKAERYYTDTGFSAELPSDIPPAFARAKAFKSDDKQSLSEYLVTVKCPQVSWQLIDKQIHGGRTKSAFWTETEATVRERELILEFNSPSQIADSRVMRVDGTLLTTEQILSELKEEKPVLVSVTGKAIDPYYSSYFGPETLVIILARDEGMGDPRLLTRQQTLPFVTDISSSVTKFIMPRSEYQGLLDTAIIHLVENAEKTDKKPLSFLPSLVNANVLTQAVSFQYYLSGDDIVDVSVNVLVSEKEALQLGTQSLDYYGPYAKKIDALGDIAYHMGEDVICFVQGHVMVKLNKGKGQGSADLLKLATTYSDWLAKVGKNMQDKPDAADGR